MAVPKTTATHAQITGGTFAAPPTGNHKVVLSALVAKGILTPSGSYAAGKGINDLDRAFQSRDAVTEIVASIATVLYGV